MCLAIPSKIVRIDGDRATVEVMGTTTTADLSMLPNAHVGEYVLVHAGFAIERYDEEVALETIDIFKEMARLNE